jgi:hypothetical protein
VEQPSDSLKDNAGRAKYRAQSMREDSFWRTQIVWRAPVLDQGNG